MNDRWEGGCWFGFLLVSYGWICGNRFKIVGLESTSLESDEKLLRYIHEFRFVCVLKVLCSEEAVCYAFHLFWGMCSRCGNVEKVHFLLECFCGDFALLVDGDCEV